MSQQNRSMNTSWTQVAPKFQLQNFMPLPADRKAGYLRERINIKSNENCPKNNSLKMAPQQNNHKNFSLKLKLVARAIIFILNQLNLKNVANLCCSKAVATYRRITFKNLDLKKLACYKFLRHTLNFYKCFGEKYRKPLCHQKIVISRQGFLDSVRLTEKIDSSENKAFIQSGTLWKSQIHKGRPF